LIKTILVSDCIKSVGLFSIGVGNREIMIWRLKPFSTGKLSVLGVHSLRVLVTTVAALDLSFGIFWEEVLLVFLKISL